MPEKLSPVQGQPVDRGRLSLEVIALDEASVLRALTCCDFPTCGRPLCFSDDE